MGDPLRPGFGGAAAAALVALVEGASPSSRGGGCDGPGYGTSSWRADLGSPRTLASSWPLAAGRGFSIFLEPGRSKTLAERVVAVREQPMHVRARNAALAPLAVLGALGWCVAMAHVARAMFASGGAVTVGTTLALASVVAAGAAGIVVLCATCDRSAGRWRSGRRAVPSLVDPIATAGAAAAISLGVVVWDRSDGDTGGTAACSGSSGC